jgi:hypothetical protein
LRPDGSLTIVGFARSSQRDPFKLHVTETRRNEEKLWLILFRVKSLRTRLNFLALQEWLFTTLAFLIGGAAMILAAALILNPLGFLLICATAVILVLTGLIRAARSGLRKRANTSKAAAIADERAALKGRLTTVLAIAQTPKRSSLWSYLVEDTYGLRADFEPARIEPRWVSRAFFGFVAAALLAMLMFPFALTRRGAGSLTTMSGRNPEINADIDNLDIRPADPALEPNAEIYADPATLRKLQDKLGRAQDEGNDKGALSRWMDKARSLGSDLQNHVTGREPGQHPPMRMRLTAKNSSARNPSSSANSGTSSGRRHDDSRNSAAGAQSGRNPAGEANQNRSPTTSTPGRTADQLAQNAPGFPDQPGSDQSQGGQGDPNSSMNDSSGSSAASNHGAGSDPQHLFGSPSSPPLGSNNFKITIDAQPSDESSAPGAPAYIPPKVRVPLNSSQYPDEALARTAVPAADQMTIKRVFER